MICAAVTQEWPFGMFPPSVPQSGDWLGSTSAEEDALNPGVMYPAFTKPL